MSIGKHFIKIGICWLAYTYTGLLLFVFYQEEVAVISMFITVLPLQSNEFEVGLKYNILFNDNELSLFTHFGYS